MDQSHGVLYSYIFFSDSAYNMLLNNPLCTSRHLLLLMIYKVVLFPHLFQRFLHVYLSIHFIIQFHNLPDRVLNLRTAEPEITKPATETERNIFIKVQVKIV